MQLWFSYRQAQRRQVDTRVQYISTEYCTTHMANVYGNYLLLPTPVKNSRFRKVHSSYHLIQKNRFQYQIISRVSHLLHKQWKNTTPMNQRHFQMESILLIPISVESTSSIEVKSLLSSTTLYYRQTTEIQGTLLAKIHRCELHE